MKHSQSQCGIALPAGLTFLVVLSLVGISSVNTAQTETHSAIVFDHQHKVFHCAESAIQAASECIATPTHPQCATRLSLEKTLISEDTQAVTTVRLQVPSMKEVREAAMKTNNGTATVFYNCNSQNEAVAEESDET